MRGKYIALCLIIIFLASACSTLEGKKVSENEIKELYPCLEVSCASNEVCSEGICVCAPDFKMCPGESTCIPDNQCCADTDCGFGETCINNECKFSCNNVETTSNLVCDPAAKEVVCMPNYKWCEIQDLCIPNDHCCKKFDCGRDMKCIRTSWAAELCLEGLSKNCRFIHEGAEKKLSVGKIETTIRALEFFYDKKAKLIIDGKEVELTRGSRYSLSPEARIFLVNIKEYGGICKRK